MIRSLIGKKGRSTKRLFKLTATASKSDLEYLDRTMAALKRTRQRTNKSELIALAVALLRQKSTIEIERMLDDREARGS
jgi:hypothetical protein